jgi:metal-responsive CopG/Arc/MetJ family transcriptional regulator
MVMTRTEQINVALTKDELGKIDAYIIEQTKKEGKIMNRSQLIRMAIEHYISNGIQDKEQDSKQEGEQESNKSNDYFADLNF